MSAKGVAQTMRWTMRVRRFRGRCFYCGRPGRRDVCSHCEDLPRRDPHAAAADQWEAAR